MSSHPNMQANQPVIDVSDQHDEIEAQSRVSRRNLLWRASILSLTIPGLGMALTSCDRDNTDSHKAQAHGVPPMPTVAPGGTPEMPGMETYNIWSMMSPETIAAAPLAKLTVFDPALPPPPPGRTLRLHWHAQEAAIRVSPTTLLATWTFEHDVPGPIGHCRVGDTVEFTLTNDTSMPHSMDFHAALIDPTVAFRSATKDQSVSYSYAPSHAGAFLYHCGTPPMLLHMGAGMYGAMIVSPREPLPPAREFVLVQGEYYLGTPTGGVYPPDFNKMLAATPDLVAFNGRPAQYMTNPIRVKVGQRVRFWVVNAGPSLPCAFHVVGQQFETVYLGEPPYSAIHGVQTFDVAPGGGMAFDMMCDFPGEFHFLNHAAAYAQKGAMGTLIVEA